MSTATALPEAVEVRNMERPKTGVLCLILTEISLFSIFIAAYIFYLGKSNVGPYPKDVLTVPIWATICLLSSSITMEFSIKDLRRDDTLWAKIWLGITAVLGATFLAQTAYEWNELINVKGLKISTNIFGTTYYSLVGLHASHVLMGVILMLITVIAGFLGADLKRHETRLEALSWYWHFVDVVWIAVFITVYMIGL